MPKPYSTIWRVTGRWLGSKAQVVLTFRLQVLLEAGGVCKSEVGVNPTLSRNCIEVSYF
jgi:hypothetical protein